MNGGLSDFASLAAASGPSASSREDRVRSLSKFESKVDLSLESLRVQKGEW